MNTEVAPLAPLAVRYRPQVLEHMVGQDKAVATLRGMLKRGAPHQTILLEGPTGSGKTTLARMIAEYLECQDSSSLEPCGKCYSCTVGKHPDVMEVNGTAYGKVDHIRGILKVSTHNPSTNYRIFIIDEFQGLTGPSVQAVLKDLEEPAPRTVWILTTNEVHKIPKTILGRCLRIPVRSVKPKDCAQLLIRVANAEGYSSWPESIFELVAETVNGSPREALQALESVIFQVIDSGLSEPQGDGWEDSLVKIVEDSVSVPGTKLVADWLAGVYTGNLKRALLASWNTDNPEYLMTQLIKGHQSVLAQLIGAPDSGSSAFHKRLNKAMGDTSLGINDAPRLSAMLPILIDYQSQQKQYLVDAGSILVAATAKLIDQFSGHNGVVKEGYPSTGVERDNSLPGGPEEPPTSGLPPVDSSSNQPAGPKTLWAIGANIGKAELVILNEPTADKQVLFNNFKADPSLGDESTIYYGVRYGPEQTPAVVLRYDSQLDIWNTLEV